MLSVKNGHSETQVIKTASAGSSDVSSAILTRHVSMSEALCTLNIVHSTLITIILTKDAPIKA